MYCFSILLTSVLLYWHWEAMLISYLATRKIVLPFNNVEELVKKSNYKIAINPGTTQEDVFKYSSDESWQKAWNDRIEPYLQNYAGIKKFQDIMKFPMEDSEIAVYDNFYTQK